MTVLTPLEKDIMPPDVELVADNAEQTACVVRFGECEDRITFWARRDNIETDNLARLKTGMRVKVVRNRPGTDAMIFTVPTLPGPYVVE